MCEVNVAKALNLPTETSAKHNLHLHSINFCRFSSERKLVDSVGGRWENMGLNHNSFKAKGETRAPWSTMN